MVGAPVNCPHCGSGNTEVNRIQYEYQRGAGGQLIYSTARRQMRCRDCGSAFESDVPPEDDPPQS